SMERMCLALGVSSLDDLAREIDELMTPPMPKGVFDAMKLIPLAGRLSDLLPKRVRDAPCDEVVRRGGSLDVLPIMRCWPEGVVEHLVVSLHHLRRIEMVKAVTVDLEVPASAHIVLEGYVDPADRRREGPFGDHTGFYSQPDDYPVFRLTCITQRNRPTYL